MSATFPYQCDWAPSPTMEPSRLKVAFGDGYEQRASAGLNPFLASYDLAFSVRSEAEANAIYAWLQFNNAHVDPFYWDPTWISTTASGEQFGTGDGARSQWRLSKSGIYVSRDISLTYITREDWQGVVDLSPVSRTNYLRASQEFDNAAWNKYASGTATVPVVTANAAAAPDGTTTADRCQFARGAGASGSDICTISQNVTTATIGNPYAPATWLKSNTGANQQVMIYWSGIGAGSIANVVTVTPAWQKFSYPGLATVTTIGVQFGCRASYGYATLDILAWGAQLEPGTVAGGYIPTTTSSVSVTDYTHASGLITLGQAPVAGAVLRWGGSGKTHLRWIADKWTPPEPVSYNNWRVQATFRQVP